jgi:arylsulfatase A-like enzyme
MMPETQGTKRRPINIFKFVALTVVSIFLLIFVSSFLALVTNAAGLGESDFVELAKNEYKGYMAWNNLVLLLKGYGLICLAYTLVLYPIVVLWLSRKRRREPTRWSVVWRTGVIVILSICAVYLRLFRYQPYFTDTRWFDAWYFKIFDYLPAGLMAVFFFLILKAVPTLVVMFAVFFYGKKVFFGIRGASHRQRRMVYSVAGIAGLVFAALFMLPGAVTTDAASAEETKRPMNVLILASDSLRADRLSCNGYFREVSPNIDALAAKSTNFTKCFTPIGSTLESMTGMMTSQYPHTHGFRQMFPNKEAVAKVEAESRTLATALAEKGYETSVMGDWCAGIFNLLPMGFEEIMVSDFDNFKVWMSQAIYLNHVIIPLYFDNEFGYWLFPKLQSFSYFLKPEVVTDRVVRKIEKQAKREAPFFWTVFYSCNHLNYHSPDPYYQKWTDPNYAGDHKYQVSLDPDEFARTVDSGDRYARLAKEDVEQIIGLYDGCTSQFDDSVGRIIAKLKETGQLENTIIFVMSDHGDDQFEPNVSFCHGITFSGGDQGTNIPCVMYVPGMEETASKVDKIVRNIDVAPTILDMLGFEPEPTFEGTSLKPYVKDSNADLSLAYFGETSYLFFKRRIPGEETLHIPAMHHTTHIDNDFDFHIVLKDRYLEGVIKTKERVLRTEDFKLVYTPGQNYPIHRLYDIANDPHCERDVKEQFPEVYRKMKKHLWAWILDQKQSTVSDIMNDSVEEEFTIPASFLEIDWGVDEVEPEEAPARPIAQR